MQAPVVDLAVAAPDPAFGGGGRAQTEAFVAAATALGRSPSVLYPAHPGLAGRRASLDRIEAVRQARAARRLAPALRTARSAWVVSTVAVQGGAAARSGREYSAWIGTSLADEWRGRARGLSAARRAAYSVSLPYLRRLERDVLTGASPLFATGEAAAHGIAEATGLPEEGIGILPIPVDLELFRPEDEAVWGERLSSPVVLFVGRADDPRKNVRLLLDAAPLLRRLAPSARIRLVGRPPAGEAPDGVEVVGTVPSVAGELRTASLFVLPSWQEGFGIVAAEALASGVPVLATRSGGPEELLRRSGGGRLLESFEPEELASAAAALLGDAATLAAMRSQGRAYVEREHSPDRLRELLRPLLASTR